MQPLVATTTAIVAAHKFLIALFVALLATVQAAFNLCATPPLALPKVTRYYI